MQPERNNSQPSPDDDLDVLFSLTYEELKRIASWVKGRDPSATLNPTALVNEAWIKLSKSPQFGHLDPQHFKLIAARAMRQVLVEAARRRGAQKRNAAAPALPLDWAQPEPDSPGHEQQLAALDEALRELAAIDARHAAIVEARFFGGFEMAEIAVMLSVSESTVTRDWRLARAWLGQRMAKK